MFQSMFAFWPVSSTDICSHAPLPHFPKHIPPTLKEPLIKTSPNSTCPEPKKTPPIQSLHHPPPGIYIPTTATTTMYLHEPPKN